MGASTADILHVRYLTYPDNLDVALCIVEFQEGFDRSKLAQIPKIGIDTSVPCIGSEVFLVSLSGFIFEKTAVENETAEWKIENRPVVRVGTIVSHEHESMGNHGSCYVTSIPVSSGMSGGFIYKPSDGGPVGACGIISSGPNEDHYQTEFVISGSSTIVDILGCLGLDLPFINLNSGIKLLDFVKSGAIKDISNDSHKISIEYLEGVISICRNTEMQVR